jgi:predicted DsbA family dithiol-disulfide isomerase
MDLIEVFAEVSCPFTYVGLRRFVAERTNRGLTKPLLKIRAWPLELVNGVAFTGAGVAPAVAALRAQVTPELFGGFNPESFPASTLGVLAAEAAAHAAGPEVGEHFSLEVRSVLFDRGIDPSDPEVLQDLLADHEVDPATVDPDAARKSWEEGKAIGVTGSTYFVVGNHGWFCPSLEIGKEGGLYDVKYDVETLDRFFAAAFADQSVG